ncbi:hypothetical protein L7F22_056948 [Adiantum nelumboides]|nr:hypothetical protein [Adiantum nelumboides]
MGSRTTRSGRSVTRVNYGEHGDDDDDEEQVKPRQAKRKSRQMDDFVADDDDEDVEDEYDEEDEDEDYGRRSASRRQRREEKDFVKDDEDEEDPDEEYGGSSSRKPKRNEQQSSDRKSRLEAMAARRRATQKAESEYGEETEEAEAEDDDDDEEDLGEMASDEEILPARKPRSYKLRTRTKQVNYNIAPPPLDAIDPTTQVKRGRGRPKEKFKYDLSGLNGAISGLPGTRKSIEDWGNLPASMSGKDYDRLFGKGDPDSSDEDIPASRKAGANAAAIFGGSAAGGLLGTSGVGGGGGAAGGSALGADLGANRDAMGRMKGTTELADVDPLGVDMKIDFSSVGGLDQHIQQLKEMVSLPLLYPEVFQRFKVTPPRGVLFHGPPGTGKTLVARALAASCSSSGQQISFFMRKGADCLSKWVGEAERQLRLLFEEARASQPSIIFFDEIDGLAPVRSSKQDQIHASIVSTLLALMDGMDGRGQVVVIGATNRPDSVDPALRRPGRFDREFYFALPNREARKSIINIHTQGWDPPLDDSFKDRLAEVTKGYGGADLRALCTEAALNAIQRRYPQIYSTTERLQLAPETIKVDAKDFMMSVNKVVPSSARSSTSSASPLPEHLRPLLSATVEEAIAALGKVMPPSSKRNPLEEAMWEDDDQGPSASSDGGFGREMMLQSFEKMRVFRPRFLIHGRPGMGQTYVGAALLQHLEGYHVQVLDVGSIMGDSSVTPEACVVQKFNEARRHKPSILFIPDLVSWSNSVSESVRTTTKSLLDGVSPSDPILLLAIAEEPISALPRDVRPWFGYMRTNKVEVTSPSLPERQAYLSNVLGNQANDDARLLEHLKFRLGPVLADLRKRFPRFKKDVWDEYNLHELTQQFDWRRETNKVIVTLLYEPDSQLIQRRRRSSADPERLGAHRIATNALAAEDSREVSRGGSADVTLQVPNLSSDQPTASQESLMAAGNGIPLMPSAGTGANGYNSGQHLNGSAGGSLTGLAAAMAGGFSSANPPPANPTTDGQTNGMRKNEFGFYVRDLHIWTMTLEKMQKRLYYNGYLTCKDFMDDLGKIVSNAEEASEVDEERLTRAQQLRNVANILIDQYVDTAFRVECERMSERMLKREEEAKAAEEKAKADAGAAAAGEATATTESNSDKKRSAMSSDEAETGVDDEVRKRARLQGEETDLSMDLGHEQATLLGQGIGSSTVSSGPQMQAQAQLDPSLYPPPHGFPAYPSSLAQDKLKRAQPYLNGISSPIVHALGTPPPQAAPLPPFKVDRQQLDQLFAYMLGKTSMFNIEQLEQLRAAAFDVIWKRRSEWDRSELIKELRVLTEEIVEAVEEEERDRNAILEDQV